MANLFLQCCQERVGLSLSQIDKESSKALDTFIQS
jgi:hypothetical protein